MDPLEQPGTHIIAIGALVSPLWLHNLSDVSTTALPILGCGWLLLQSAVYLYDNFWKKKKP